MIVGELISFLLAGLIAGICSGMFGLGGGVIFIPVQILIYSILDVPTYLQIKLAIGTSLLATSCATFASARAHAKHNAVRWDLIYKISPGIIIGALLGALIARGLPSGVLEVLFGAFLCTIACYLYFFVKYHEHGEGNIPNSLIFNIIGSLVGIIAAMMGVSGGFIIAPILMLFHVPLRKAIGTASAAGFVLSIFGAIAYLFPSFSQDSYPYSIGYLYLPAFIPLAVGSMLSARWGVFFTHRLPIVILKKILAVMLFLIGILMIAR